MPGRETTDGDRRLARLASNPLDNHQPDEAQLNVTAMNPVLEEILRTGDITSTGGEIIKVHSEISEEEGESLQEMIRDLRPKVSLEIGLGFGISSLYLYVSVYMRSAS